MIPRQRRLVPLLLLNSAGLSFFLCPSPRECSQVEGNRVEDFSSEGTCHAVPPPCYAAVTFGMQYRDQGKQPLCRVLCSVAVQIT